MAARSAHEFFLECVADLLEVHSGDRVEAAQVRDGAKVTVTLEPGRTPAVVERYAIDAPWASIDGAPRDIGAISVVTPLTQATLGDVDEVARLVRGVQGRITAMRSAASIARRALTVLEGKDSLFEPLEMPVDFSDWAIIGVWARVYAAGEVTLSLVEDANGDFTDALSRRFVDRSESNFWGAGHEIPRGVEIATVTSTYFAALICLGIKID